MIRNIALALTVAAISTGAAAQSKTPILPMKVIDITPSGTAAQTCKGWNCGATPITGSARQAQPIDTGFSNVQVYATNPSLLDGCVYRALGRTPIVEGARVASTGYKFSSSYRSLSDYWDIFVTIEFNGKLVHYRYDCRVWGTGAELTR